MLQAPRASSSEAAAIAARFDDADLFDPGPARSGTVPDRDGRDGPRRRVPRRGDGRRHAGEVSPINAGIVYCAAIEAFQAIFDLRRAQEWTTALSRWCDDQPDLVPFRGRCLVYRAELMQFHGLWKEAVEEGRPPTGCQRPPPEPAIGEAHYQQAELHRLRGEDDAAEQGYRAASQWGRRPDPGLALLRLAQGDIDAAAASIRRALDESDEFSRPSFWSRSVEIMLAARDVAAARAAADELAALADRFDATLPRAIASRAAGTVQLAEGDARGALATLRRAWELWLDLEAPYESARVRVQIALACRALGDADTAELELDGGAAGLCRSGRGSGRRPGGRADGAGRRRPRERAQPARDRGPAAGRGRADEPRHRDGSRHQRADGRSPREQCVLQARRVVASSGHRLRLRAPLV